MRTIAGLTLLFSLAIVAGAQDRTPRRGAGTNQEGVEFARPDGSPLYLNLHVPDGAGPFPAAILVHGGGFDEGDRVNNVRSLIEPLENANFAWFSIDYRLAPKYHFPEAIADVQTAVRWVRSNASGYRVDASKIALMGESAGGLLVNYAGTHETPETRTAVVVDIYGPIDYGKLAEERRDHPERFNMASIQRHAANGGGIHFFGAEELDEKGLSQLHSLAPISAVHKGMPPFLCIHGTKDDQVSYSQSVAMCDRMKAVGASCKLISVEGGGHGMGGWRAPEMQAWKGEMIAWLREKLNLH